MKYVSYFYVAMLCGENAPKVPLKKCKRAHGYLICKDVNEKVDFIIMTDSDGALCPVAIKLRNSDTIYVDELHPLSLNMLTSMLN